MTFVSSVCHLASRRAAFFALIWFFIVLHLARPTRQLPALVTPTEPEPLKPKSYRSNELKARFETWQTADGDPSDGSREDDWKYLQPTATQPL
jgi:hypothetical protein